MEAIPSIAKKTKKGTYKIELPNISVKDEIKVMIVFRDEEEKKEPKKHWSDFAGKMKTKIDWIAYQKEIRNEW